ncbi:MAG: phosphate acetyltransferase [Neisseriaceae bacterium]|nr:MAG: phosphate acetyltransferase [Neisseriaceae bacterium]
MYGRMIMTNFLIVPINVIDNIFKTGVLLYLAAQKRKKNVTYQRIIQSKSLSEDESLFEAKLNIDNQQAISLSSIKMALASGKIDDLSEQIAAYFYSEEIRNYEMVFAEGVAPDIDHVYLFERNRYIASILKAQVIFLVDAKNRDASEVFELIKNIHDYSFDPNTQKLGFVLLNVGENIQKYKDQVSTLILENKMNLSCLLAIADDLSSKNLKDLEMLSDQIDFSVLEATLNLPTDQRMAPSVYREIVIDKARRANKRIVLPEGDEIRTIQAAIICHQKKIAQCILLAKIDRVQKIVDDLGLRLPDDIEIVDPETIVEQYVQPLVEIRKHKGLTEDQARKLLEDNVFVGTMMLQMGAVDGLVSGAVHTTANTIRPALQIVKMDQESTMVSSVFFMLMPNEVYVFADCAVNTELNAEQMAEVAIQSADSAKAFGINEPKVAMISYSTKDSGSGLSVDKVKQATAIVKTRRPDILVDGPLQYDAACTPSVGQKKAPGSRVAGYANVFIFPDLNTGNTTYKAVQRTGNILSVGPMLQGLNKAVNDLSRGASVEDIVFTIAITAIQAQQKA